MDKLDLGCLVFGSTRKISSVVLALWLTAYASNNSANLDSPIQPGQIVGGATKQIYQVQPVSGFLPQPSLLQPGGDGRAAPYYINTSVPLSNYNKVLLDPVQIW